MPVYESKKIYFRMNYPRIKKIPVMAAQFESE
jgi:hypothetical protein